MSRRVLGIIIAIVGIAVAVLGAYSIRQILTTSFAPAAVATPINLATEKVVVVTRDLAVGAVIKPSDVREEDIPVNLIPRNAIRDLNEVVERMVKVPLVTGEMVLAHHVADPNLISHDIAFTMSDNMVLMAFPATDLMSSLNVLQRGDLVDIFVSIEETVEVVEGGRTDTQFGNLPQPTPTPQAGPVTLPEENPIVSRLFTFDALQATDISAIIADITYEQGSYTSVPLGAENEVIASTEPIPSSVRVRSYLLILNPQDALLLKHLVDIGATFDLVLRAPTSDQLFDLQPVISEYLIDRYQLEVPR